MKNSNSIEAIEEWTETPLSIRYVEILEQYGGKILGASVLLYAADDVVERNETFETKVYCPGYLAIGDDSGGCAFMLAIRVDPSPVFIVDHGSMSTDDFTQLASDIDIWLIDVISRT